MIANDFNPVTKRHCKGITITRVQIAQWSDELNAQGKLLSRQRDDGKLRSPGWHCFTVKFERAEYIERMRFDENGKVVDWNFHMMRPYVG